MYKCHIDTISEIQFVSIECGLLRLWGCPMLPIDEKFAVL